MKSVMVKCSIFILILNVAIFNTVRSSSDHFSLRMLNMNVWGIRYYSERKDERMKGIVKFLQNSDYDIIFIQELWTPKDYKMLKKLYKYSTQHGSPDSYTCPLMDGDDDVHFLRISPLDCNGLTILSKHKILDTEYVFYDEKVPALMETVVRKGALAVKMELVKKSVDEDGHERLSRMRVTAVNSHFSGWFSKREETYSYIRLSQARSLLHFINKLKHDSDVVILAADLNSTPHSPVYHLLTSHLSDSLTQYTGDLGSWSPEYDTWGHVNNTWSGPAHPHAYKQRSRIDYIMYTVRRGLEVQVEQYKTIAKDMIINYEIISLSDHAWTEATLKIYS